MKGIKREEILDYSGWIRNLDGLVPYLRNGQVVVEKEFNMTGDAPKLFIREYQYGEALKRNPKKWPAYIAKVGHKWYPNESITEQLFTDLGKLYGVKIAESKLALASGQLRFLSRYFLKEDERLMHGAEIYAAYLHDDIEFVEEIENNKMSSDFFTVDFTLKALKHSFPDYHEELFCKLLEMLTFDAITGNNDRHFYNWGIVIDVHNVKNPEFAPIYDTARGLFWNYTEDKIRRVTEHQNMIDVQIENYGKKSKPKIGIENRNNLNHFQCIEEIYSRFLSYSKCVTKVIHSALQADERELIDDKFRLLLSEPRRKLIIDCLHYRKQKLLEIANKYDEAA